MHWVISYDIKKDKSRRRVAKRLEQVGFRRQKSVFEGDLSRYEMKKLTQELADEIDPETDQITAWPANVLDAALIHQGVPRAETQTDFRIL